MLQVQSKGHFKAGKNNDVHPTIANIISQNVVVVFSIHDNQVEKKGALFHSRRVDVLVVVRGVVQLAMHYIAAVRSGKKGLEPPTHKGTPE
jgi:hypothetical protein